MVVYTIKNPIGAVHQLAYIDTYCLSFGCYCVTQWKCVKGVDVEQKTVAPSAGSFLGILRDVVDDRIYFFVGLLSEPYAMLHISTPIYRTLLQKVWFDQLLPEQD